MTTANANDRYHAAIQPTDSCACAGALVQTIGQWVETLLAWRDRARQRRQLQTMSDRLLNDIGLTRADTEHEASKAFWRG